METSLAKPKSEPESPDTPCRCGGRRPSSCSALIGLNYFALGWCLAFAIAGQSVLVAIVGMLNIPVIVRAYMHEQNDQEMATLRADAANTQTNL